MTKTAEDYYRTYSGKRLLEKYTPEDYGIWKVHGEDENCDFGGPRSIPFLGYFEGKLKDVVDHVVSMRGFWSWGGGGDIVKESPPSVIKIDSDFIKDQKRLKEEQKELRDRLAELENKIVI